MQITPVSIRDFTLALAHHKQTKTDTAMRWDKTDNGTQNGHVLGNQVAW